MAGSNLKKALQVKVQSTEGTFDAPSSGDGVPASELNYTTGAQRASTNEFTGSIDQSPEIVQTLRPTISGKVYFRGWSGSPAALPFSAILQAAGFSEQIISTAIPASPGAPAGTPGTTQIRLPSGASTTDEIYEGARLIVENETFSNVAGRNNTLITRYEGSLRRATLGEETPVDMTGNVQLPPQVLYNLGSSNFPVLSAYYYEDGYRMAIKDIAITSFSITLPDPQGTELPYFNFEGVGSIEGDADQVTPVTVSELAVPPYRKGRYYLDRKLYGGNGLTIDLGPDSQRPSDVNEDDGARAAQLVQRSRSATLNILQENGPVAYQDLLTYLQDQTVFDVMTSWGNTEGSRFGLTLSRLRMLDLDPSDQGSFLGRSIPVSIDGANTGVALSVY